MNMNRLIPFFSTIVATVLASGCASKGHRSTQQEVEPVPVMVSPQMVTLAQSEPTIVPSGERKRLHNQTPIPVWQPARVQRVYMAGHVNERNEAYYRSKKEVIVERGQWNLDALNNPELSYIPEASTVPVPTAPGRNYTHMVSPGRIAPSPIEQMETNGFAENLESVEHARVLGLTEYSQEQQARALESETHAVAFFDDLGWCLVPRERLLPVKSMPNQ
jgi:hypothetical protein